MSAIMITIIFGIAGILWCAVAGAIGGRLTWRYLLDLATGRTNYGYQQHPVYPILGVLLLISVWLVLGIISAAWQGAIQ